MCQLGPTESNLKSIIGPAAKLHLAALIVEGEPRNVDFTCRFEDARRHIEAGAVVADHHVGLVGAIEALVGAVVHQHIRFPDAMRRYTQILDTAIVCCIPAQIHVVPFQFEPHVCD